MQQAVQCAQASQGELADPGEKNQGLWAGNKRETHHAFLEIFSEGITHFKLFY